MSTVTRQRLLARRVLSGLIAAAVVVTACGGGNDRALETTPDPIGTEVDVTAGPVAVASAGPAGVVLPDEVRDQVINSVRDYVIVASVEPLRTGDAAGDLDALFTPAATARANGIDRPVLTDEGLPPATKTVTARAAPVSLTVLADQVGSIVLITAALDLEISSTTAGGDVTIRRTGELTFGLDAEVWKIASFDVTVTREGAGTDEPPTETKQEGSS